MREVAAFEHESDLYSGFAGPLWHLDETYLDAIVSTYYEEYFRHFLAQYEAKLERSSSGLANVIDQSAANLSFGTAWHYSSAGIREAVVNRVSDDDALDAAVSCAIHLLASGVAGEFRASSERGFRVVLQSRLIAPAAKNIHVWRRGDNGEVMADDKSTTFPSGPRSEEHTSELQS